MCDRSSSGKARSFDQDSHPLLLRWANAELARFFSLGKLA